MKRLTALTLALLLALSLSACKKAEEEAPDRSGPVSSAPEKKEPPEGFLSVSGEPLKETTLASVSASAIVTEGRVPEGEYDLPTEIISLEEWEKQGGIAQLDRLHNDSAAFYAVEGKEFSPALIRWEDSLVEFDWAYATSRGYQPIMWRSDMDGDGDHELAVVCDVASGTDVSFYELHVLEKNDDGTLTAYTYPWETLAAALDSSFQIAFSGDKTYVNIGQEYVDITEVLGSAEPKYTGNGLEAGPMAAFERMGAGFAYYQGLFLETENVGSRPVALLGAEGSYQDGTFLLDNLSVWPMPNA